MKRLTNVRNRVTSNATLPGIAVTGIMNPISDTSTIAAQGM